MRAAALGLLLLSLAVSASACIMCNKKVFPFEHLHEKPSHILNFCEPGYYDAKTGLGLPFFCQPCGKGYYCDSECRHCCCLRHGRLSLRLVVTVLLLCRQQQSVHLTFQQAVSLLSSHACKNDMQQQLGTHQSQTQPQPAATTTTTLPDDPTRAM
jgi:hypothetical protein